MERRASQFITYHNLIELFLVDVLINVRKTVTFEVAPIFFFVGICDIYLKKSLFRVFFLGFDIGKTIPVYISTLLVMSFI